MRIDRTAGLAAAAAAALVLLTAMLLMGYLVLAVSQLFRSAEPVAAPAFTLSGLSWSPSSALGLVGMDMRSSRLAVFVDGGQLRALDLDSGTELPGRDPASETQGGLHNARNPLLLQLSDHRLLVLDVTRGIGVLRWSIADQPQSPASPAETSAKAAGQAEAGSLLLRSDWGEFTEHASPQASNNPQLLQAALAGADNRLRLLTLWQHDAAAELRWYALSIAAGSAPELRLLQSLPVASIRVPPDAHSDTEVGASKLSAADISSMLPDQTGGAYLGLASGELLHISGMPSNLASSLHSTAGAALTALIALPQAGLLAAHADGNVNEFSRTQSGLVAGAHYRCADKRLAAIAVDPQQRWLACVGDDVLRLFYLGRPRPVWQVQLGTADDSASAALLAVDKGVVLLVQPSAAGAVSVNSWQFAAQPVVDMQTLWLPQQHQGEAEPGWQWEPQASSQSSARLSLLPLLFGTFKAAMLGMVIALPLALLGAIYTALLMSARWRERIKPMVEMLESLPTVILGFIGALWLAPLLQQHLLSLLLLLLLMPVTLPLTGYYWSCSLKQRVAVQLRPTLPYLLFAAQLLLVIALGALVQWLLFADSFSAWLETAAGWTYDLHNALLVGLVLGLGILPSIFALVEDALSAVPQRLQMASLALGASRWQTVWQVMLPAASAGILAAVLIGFGRALGETMIVLMVSSNTPIMESSLLRGLQAIAPTLASEMSEASPDSVHFRVLLFAALVLFAFTFVMNTLAELFRARLRRRYQS